jgi:hypothetical protein
VPRKAKKRNEAPSTKHSVRGASTLGKPRKHKASAKESLEELFGIEPFHRNEITAREIRQLQHMIDEKGIPTTCKDLNLDKGTLLMVTSGFGHCMRPYTAERLRTFLRNK